MLQQVVNDIQIILDLGSLDVPGGVLPLLCLLVGDRESQLVEFKSIAAIVWEFYSIVNLKLQFKPP